MLVPPTEEDEVPVLHGVHAVTSVAESGAYVPAGHVTQSPAVVLKNCPAAHVPYRRMMVPADPLPPFESLAQPPPDPVLLTASKFEVGHGCPFAPHPPAHLGDPPIKADPQPPPLIDEV